MTYQQAEAKAKRLSELGFRLRMDSYGVGWRWKWQNIPVWSYTDAAPKSVALIFALQEINL